MGCLKKGWFTREGQGPLLSAGTKVPSSPLLGGGSHPTRCYGAGVLEEPAALERQNPPLPLAVGARKMLFVHRLGSLHFGC